MSMAIQYTPSMRAMLDWFDSEPCSCATIGQIADENDLSRETVRNNLKQLAAGGYAELRHESTAVYRLIEDPREDGQ